MNKEDFKNLVLRSDSYSDILRTFNMSCSGGSLKILKKRISEDNIDVFFFKERQSKNQRERAKLANYRRKKPLVEILKKDSHYSNYHLKKRLIEEGVLENKCSHCNLLPEWNKKPLSLQLDHIDGDNSNNERENLRLLCPNCHSQTPTFAGKKLRKINNCKKCGIAINHKSIHCILCFKTSHNSIERVKEKKLKVSKQQKKKCRKCEVFISNASRHELCVDCMAFQTRKVERPSYVELEGLIRTRSFIYIAKQYGVSDNAVRKWCKYYNLPYRRKDIVEYFKE